MSKKWFHLLLPVFFLCSCSNNHPAPVEDAFKSSQYSTNYYRVRVGDTLYSIAWSFNVDYLKLASFNNLPAPYKIRVGQRLLVRGSAKGELKKHRKIKNDPIFAGGLVKNWYWPATGKVISGFSASPYGNKGVNISGHLGDFVHSSAKGVVVYSGAGVRGYGNLIIIKHNKEFLSAYAFNQRNLTKEGMKVQAGQKIATMGRDNAGTVLLHFELRQRGHPVDPLNYLR